MCTCMLFFYAGDAAGVGLAKQYDLDAIEDLT